MPLYSCQCCGWTTTDSWRHAVPGHASSNPGCRGTIALVRGPVSAAPRRGGRRDPDPVVFLHPAPGCGGGDAA